MCESKYIDCDLEVIDFFDLNSYKEYLQYLNINALRRIFRYYYPHLSDIELDSVLDTRTYYINKILDYFDYDKNLF